MGRALVKKINEFDIDKNTEFVKKKFSHDPVQLKKELLYLEKYQENNRNVLAMIKETFRSKSKYLAKMNKDEEFHLLVDNMQKLKDLVQ